MPLLNNKVEHQNNPKGQAQNPIVRGKFPVHQSSRNYSSYRLNKVLASLMVFCFLLSMTTYTFVLNKESMISDLHKQINETNFENIDLQNRVDHLQSFYNINKRVSKVDFLKQADKIIEVESAKQIKTTSNALNTKVHTISGY